MKSILILCFIALLAHSSSCDSEDCGDFNMTAECNFDDDCPYAPCIAAICPENSTDCPPCYINKCIWHKCVPIDPLITDKCKISGCSSELCVALDDEGVSPCIYKPELRCYPDYGLCSYSYESGCRWVLSPSFYQCYWKAENDLTEIP